MAGHVYAIALGSNRRHGAHGGPKAVLRAALAALEGAELRVTAVSRLLASPAIGPAGRDFANGAALVATPLAPPALLARLKGVEKAFGRRAGRRWGPRVLDLDIILWSGGRWAERRLAIPHPGLALRDFVLMPLAEIAPRWRDPASGRTVAQLAARHARPSPVDRARAPA